MKHHLSSNFSLYVPHFSLRTHQNGFYHRFIHSAHNHLDILEDDWGFFYSSPLRSPYQNNSWTIHWQQCKGFQNIHFKMLPKCYPAPRPQTASTFFDICRVNMPDSKYQLCLTRFILHNEVPCVHWGHYKQQIPFLQDGGWQLQIPSTGRSDI